MKLTKQFGIEIFWAGVVGFVLGLIVSFLLTVLYQYAVISTEHPIVPFYYKDIIKAQMTPLTLELDLPDETVLTDIQVLTVHGTTSKNATVLTEGGAEAVSTESAHGRFTLNVPLSEGVNELTFSSYSEKGEVVQMSRTVIYSQESQEVPEQE